MANLSIPLSDAMRAWIEDQARSGAFPSGEAYLRDLIAREKARLDAIAAIQADIDEVLASGEPEPLDFDALLFELRAEAAAG